MHGNLSSGVNVPRSSKIAADGYVQSHHPIQNEWAKRWAKENKHNENQAPATLLESSSETHTQNICCQRARRRVEDLTLI